MDEKTTVAVSAIILVVAFTLSIIAIKTDIIIAEEEEDGLLLTPNGDFILNTTLPTIQPVVSSLDVTGEQNTNKTLIREYFEEYYPTHTNLNFTNLGNGEFWCFVGDECFIVSNLGRISYSNENNETLISKTEFNSTEAILISDEYISNHGGKGSFNVTRIGEDRNRNDQDNVYGYMIEYRRVVNGYTVYGMDGIRTYVPYNEPISYFWRNAFNYTVSSNSQQVINAESAFNNLNSNNIFDTTTPITIDSIELVYLQPYCSKNITPEINPAWKFSSLSNGDFFVDAFTGEMYVPNY